MEFPPEVHEWVANREYLKLAKYLKDHYTTPGRCVVLFSELTGQPYHNTLDLPTWEYYGGDVSDEELLERMKNWDSSDEFYLNLIKNKGFSGS